MKTVNAVAAIILKGEKILVMQCGDGDKWKLPEGKIKLGESPEKALVREIRAELSVKIDVEEWTGTVEFDYPTFHIIMRSFICRITSGKLFLRNHGAFKWVALNEIKNVDWIPEDKQLIDKIDWWFLDWKIDHMNISRRQKGDLYAYVSDGTKTLTLMDKFEGRGCAEGPYKRLIFENTHDATIGDYLCKYHLIVERYPDIKHTEGNITFSEFKKEKGKSVYYYCSTQLREALKQNSKILQKKEIYFYVPFYLRAQNSSNREGYGWEWDWSGGVGIPNEGTYYGETDDYGFVGVQIESFEKKENPVQQNRKAPLKLHVEITMYKKKNYFKIYKNEHESFLIPCDKGMTKGKAIEIYMSYGKKNN